MNVLNRISPEHGLRLINVAQRIVAQRDITRLCETILLEAQDLTNADGGTLYLLEGRDHLQRLEFAIVRNRSLHIRLGGTSGGVINYPALPLYLSNGQANHSHVAAHVALTGELVNISDAYEAEGFDFSGTRRFDEQFHYRTQSIISVPLKTDLGDLVAVLQLLNAKDDQGNVVPFGADVEPVVEVLAGFAASALQQQRLMNDQKALLIELSGEPNTGRLLERILSEAQAITHADGGSLYLFQDDDALGERLEFALVRNDSLGICQGGNGGTPVVMPPVPMRQADGTENHHHVAAHSAWVRELINIPDAYDCEDFDFSGTKAFDAERGYRSVSFLTVPLLNHLDEIIGVFQLVNAQDPRTRDPIPFSPNVEPLIRGLASYAAIALNNMILVQEMKNLLDAFIKVIAQAIDAKSPHTSGHCQRVPLLTELLAKAACEDASTFNSFSLDDDEWYELHVAGWLHDCGKLATPDSILEKSTKLHTLHDRVEEVAARFSALLAQRELQVVRQIMENPGARQQLEEDWQRESDLIREDLAFIRRINRGAEYTADEDKQRIARIAEMTWQDNQGNEQALLTGDEVYNLCIDRGTLTHEERQIINNHMQVTIDMLESLPFPRKLRRVPEYAGGHHEKMDGSGFPRGLTRDQMSIPARMMAVADIFEALTASDRPYKKPMQISQALSILQKMRDSNHIDPDVYELFIRRRVWETYAREVLSPDQLDIEDATSYL